MAKHLSTKGKVEATGGFADVLTAYRSSHDFKKLGEKTRHDYGRWLSEMQKRWGAMPLAALEDPGVRRHFMAWRDSMAATPRSADMAIGVLKRVLGWAHERVLIKSNQAEPIKRLHRVDRSDEIWSDDELARFVEAASPELAQAVELAGQLGLRQGDLVRLRWDQRDGGCFVVKTSKRGREVAVPITEACDKVLASIARKGPTVLTTHRGGRAWTTDGLRASFAAARERAGVEKTFHDLRRTAATRLVSAGLDDTTVAQIMGWSEKSVTALKRKYVSRRAVMAAAARRLEGEPDGREGRGHGDQDAGRRAPDGSGSGAGRRD